MKPSLEGISWTFHWISMNKVESDLKDIQGGQKVTWLTSARHCENNFASGFFQKRDLNVTKRMIPSLLDKNTLLIRNLQAFAGITCSHRPLFPHLWRKCVWSATPFYEEIPGKMVSPKLCSALTHVSTRRCLWTMSTFAITRLSWVIELGGAQYHRQW